MSRTFRVRLPQDLDEQLAAICEATQLRTSTVIRVCVEFVLTHPEAWGVLRRGAPYTLIDTRTEAQREAWEQAAPDLAAFDLGEVARKMGYP